VKDGINIDEISELAKSPEFGAMSIFLGTVREDQNEDGDKVIKLIYEAYESMTKKVIRGICDKAKIKWPNLGRIVIRHRLGEVPVGDVSIVVAISSAHRCDSIDAMKYVIDTIKGKAPIFKQEVFAGGRLQWKSNKECPWAPDHQPIDTSSTNKDL